jgi:hypothetical protein
VRFVKTDAFGLAPIRSMKFVAGTPSGLDAVGDAEVVDLLAVGLAVEAVA